MNAPLTSSLLSPALIEKTITPTAACASLMAFVAGGGTAAALEDCLSQLSFPGATIRSGGIVKAIRHLGAERSPDNIIVDINLTDMPGSRVHDLGRLCEPGMTLVAIGERDGIGLYRDLLQAGVNEYIVKQLTRNCWQGRCPRRPAGLGGPGQS